MIYKLKNIGTYLLKILVSLVMIFSCIIPRVISNVYAEEIMDYEIYPTPHELIYQEGDWIIRPEVNVVFDDTIDEVTRNRVNEVLSLKSDNISVTNEKVNGKTNVLVGTYQSNQYVDNYIQKNYSINTELFKNISGNIVISNEGEICILGADTNAAFYGITSLKHIFKQMEGATIRNFIISDYADTRIRGFIEGFYGTPWSNENRKSLMKFGGDYKLTSYIFAPKHDPYHAGNKWRELYPQQELSEIEEMVNIGISSKCEFVYALHPFKAKDFMKNRTFDEEMDSILKKFEQLYSIGIRQFGILGDDVGSLDHDTIINMMTIISNWAQEKGDVKDTLFCPTAYHWNKGYDYTELNDFDAGFPDDVQIFWTGDELHGAVEQKTLDHFRRDGLNGNEERRQPLFWLNWPVLDGSDDQKATMELGKATKLKNNANPRDLAGVVTNPMQVAQASKFSLFAIADYAWNIEGFDVNENWYDSFKYVEENAPNALMTMAKHMSHYSDESTELIGLLEEVKNKVIKNENLGDSGEKLIKEMDIISNACDEFNSLSENVSLKEELRPFSNSLKDLANAIKEYINVKLYLEEGDTDRAVNTYAKASSLFTSSKNQERDYAGKKLMVKPGKKRLIPFALLLDENVTKLINDYLIEKDEEEEGLVITASGKLGGLYQGDINNILDGDPNTFVWYKSEAKGQYFQIDFNNPVTVHGIHILNGKPGKLQNTFEYAKLRYTIDGTTWEDVDGIEYGPRVEQINVVQELENVKAIRYECTKVESKAEWVAMREFKVDIDQENVGGKVYTNVNDYINYKANYAGETNKELNSIVPVTNVTLEKGQFIGLKLDRIHELKEIKSQLSKEGLSIEVAENEYEWNDVVAGEQDKNARYVRIINKAENPITFDIAQFEVITDEVSDKSLKQIIYWDPNRVTVTGELDVFDNNWETSMHNNMTQGPDRGLVYDLGQTIHFESFKAIVHDSEAQYPRHAKISVSMDGEKWTDIMYLGTQDGTENKGEKEKKDLAIIFPDNDANFRYKEVRNLDVDGRYLKYVTTAAPSCGSIYGIDMNEFEINDGEYLPISNNPTYKSNVSETKEGRFEYLTDGSLSSMFIPDSDKGYVTYSVSDENDRNAVKIIQNTSVVSNAKVSARILGTEGNSSWIDMGTLSQTVNEFILPKGTILLDVKIEWENIIPNITELSFSKVEDVRVDKTELNYLITHLEDTSKWTTKTKTEYAAAINTGKSINNSQYASKNMVDNAVKSIKDAINHKMIIGDSSKLQEVIDNAETDSSLYANISWKEYDKIIKQAKKALEDKENLSDEMINDYILSINAAKENLKYNPSVSEQAELLFEDMRLFIEEIEDVSIYTTNSYNALIKANNELENLLIKNSEDALHPNVFSEPMENVRKAKEELVLVYTLPDLIKEYETVNESLYTKESFNAYKKIVEESKELLVSGTKKTIEKAIQGINSAKGQLKLIYTSDNLKELLKIAKDKSQDNYTEFSYNNLSKSIEKAQEVVNRINEATNEEIKDVSELLQRSMNELVSIESLRTVIDNAKNFNEDMYTKKSYDLLKETIENGKKLMVDGTEEQIVESIQSIDRAVKGLIIRVNEKEANDYISSIKEINYSNYTKESGEAYEEAFNTLKKMQKDFSNISADEFKQAQIDFENAKARLKLLDADYSKVDNAIDKVNKLNKDKYKDFSDVEKAVKAVVRGKNIMEQEEVDAMAKAIEDAISRLELKEEKSNPNTGDVTNLPLFISLLGISSLAITVGLKRKKKN